VLTRMMHVLQAELEKRAKTDAGEARSGLLILGEYSGLTTGPDFMPGRRGRCFRTRPPVKRRKRDVTMRRGDRGNWTTRMRTEPVERVTSGTFGFGRLTRKRPARVLWGIEGPGIQAGRPPAYECGRRNQAVKAEGRG